MSVCLLKNTSVDQTVSQSNGYVCKPVYDFVKRFCDIGFSTVALIVLSPLMLIVIIAIFIDDPGPVFFTQIRIGKDNKPFRIFKFRSMLVEAEKMKKSLLSQNQDCGANFKIANDPRVTRVGRFIRRNNIDELPQLINVILGQMSIVGPRPFIESEQCNLPADRLVVRPGLSCYWQIGGKNHLTLHEQIDLDRKYIHERSFMVDIRIILKTLSLFLKKSHCDC